MQKLCTHCETLYTPKENHRGSEQVYCSIKCRTSAAQQRMINKIKENAIQVTILHEGKTILLNPIETSVIVLTLILWKKITKPVTRLVSLN
jgi:hypothetical protein